MRKFHLVKLALRLCFVGLFSATMVGCGKKENELERREAASPLSSEVPILKFKMFGKLQLVATASGVYSGDDWFNAVLKNKPNFSLEDDTDSSSSSNNSSGANSASSSSTSSSSPSSIVSKIAKNEGAAGSVSASSANLALPAFSANLVGTSLDLSSAFSVGEFDLSADSFSEDFTLANDFSASDFDVSSGFSNSNAGGTVGSCSAAKLQKIFLQFQALERSSKNNSGISALSDEAEAEFSSFNQLSGGVVCLILNYLECALPFVKEGEAINNEYRSLASKVANGASSDEAAFKNLEERANAIGKQSLQCAAKVGVYALE